MTSTHIGAVRYVPCPPGLVLDNDTEIMTASGWQRFHYRDPRKALLTYTGRYFWPLEALADEVDPLDIAWSLSRENRFAGHTIYPYSVAQHAYVLSLVVPEHLQKWALHHDDTEAYLKDIPRPLKRLMPDYKGHEDSLMSVIAYRFDLAPNEEPKALKEYDYRMGHAEMCVLYPETGEAKLRLLDYSDKYIDDLAEYKRLIRPVSADEACSNWLTRFRELFPEE